MPSCVVSLCLFWFRVHWVRMCCVCDFVSREQFSVVRILYRLLYLIIDIAFIFFRSSPDLVQDPNLWLVDLFILFQSVLRVVLGVNLVCVQCSDGVVVCLLNQCLFWYDFQPSSQVLDSQTIIFLQDIWRTKIPCCKDTTL